MKLNTFIDENGDEIHAYTTIKLTINSIIDIIVNISNKDPISMGYMIRHSKFKGISYNSDDEYVDQFIKLYIPPKKNKNKESDGNAAEIDVVNDDASDVTNVDGSDEVPEENIHEFSFDVAYSIDHENQILYIHDPGMGNRINLNSVQNMLQKVVAENNGIMEYNVKYRNAQLICDINEVWICSAKKSIKFY
jgi:hypothetical protein